MNGATCAAIVRSRPASEPTAQNRNWSSVSTSSSRIGRGDRPEQRGDRRAGERQLHRRRALAAERAERVDDDGRDRRTGEREPHVRRQARRRRTSRCRSTTNSAAPALTPRMPGSASGLRVTPCISAPATPRAAPTSRPSDGARHAQRADDQVVVVRRVVVAQGVDHRRQRDRLRPDGDAEQGHQHEQGDTADQADDECRPPGTPRARRDGDSGVGRDHSSGRGHWTLGSS